LISSIQNPDIPKNTNTYLPCELLSAIFAFKIKERGRDDKRRVRKHLAKPNGIISIRYRSSTLPDHHRQPVLCSYNPRQENKTPSYIVKQLFSLCLSGALQNLGGTIVEVLECVVIQVAISSE